MQKDVQNGRVYPLKDIPMSDIDTKVGELLTGYSKRKQFKESEHMSLRVINTMDENSFCLMQHNCYTCKNRSKCEKDDYSLRNKAAAAGAKAIKDEIKKEKELAIYKKAFELFVEDTLDLGATNYSKTAIKAAVKSAIKEYLDKATRQGEE